MDKRLKKIKERINDGDTQKAIQELTGLIASHPHMRAEAYYLLGNAYRKEGNWQGALNQYQEAIALNPESPARNAYDMVMDILNFYNKDMFNQ